MGGREAADMQYTALTAEKAAHQRHATRWGQGPGNLAGRLEAFQSQANLYANAMTKKLTQAH